MYKACIFGYFDSKINVTIITYCLKRIYNNIVYRIVAQFDNINDIFTAICNKKRLYTILLTIQYILLYSLQILHILVEIVSQGCDRYNLFYSPENI